MREILTLLTLAFLTTQAFANNKTCVIVYANDVPWSNEIYWHEMAHANGWTHPERPLGAAFKPGYKADKPPKKYLHKNKTCTVWPVSTAKARHTCGSYGCQWFE